VLVIFDSDVAFHADDLEVVEAICAEERSEILLDILLGKKDDNWCDIFLDLLEAIGELYLWAWNKIIQLLFKLLKSQVQLNLTCN